ncbi:MAG: DUF4403 family protein [Saprospiraceae bacterium]
MEADLSGWFFTFFLSMNKLLLLLTCCFLFSNCKTTKPSRPDEIYQSATALPASTICLPLSISLDELERTINDQVDRLFADGNVMPEDFGNGLKVAIKKAGPIKLSAKGRAVFFDLPLDLKLRQDVKITTLKASGSLSLNFQTDFKIAEDWNIKTTTLVKDYDWTKKPTLDMGLVKLPLEGLANQLINRSKETLTREIDKQLQERFALKEYAELIVDTLQKPFLVSSDYDAWLSVRPKRIVMAPLKTDTRQISTTVLLEAKTDIFLNGENRDTVVFRQLPLLEEEQVNCNGFEFYFNTAVPYEVIEAEAKKELLGETFKDGNRMVKIEDLKIFGQNDNLVINAKLSGDYDGSIYLLGKPVYNKEKGQLELADLDFELQTRQFLKKSMAWLLKRNLKKQLQENLNYSVVKELLETKSAVQKQMKKLVDHPQVEVNGNVDELTIKQLFVEKDRVVVALYTTGRVAAKIKEFYMPEE